MRPEISQRVNKLLPLKEKILLYNSLIASHFNYVDTVWSGCTNRNKNKLQRTQNLAVKSMLGMNKKESTTAALKQAHLLPLEDKRNIHEAVYIHKGLSGNLPAATCRTYQQHQPLKQYRSADRLILNIPKHKTENFKNSPLYRTINVWNSIPLHIKLAETTTSFRNQLQTHKLTEYNSRH